MSTTVDELKAQIGAMQRELEELRTLADSLRPWTEWVEVQNAATQRKLGRAEAQTVAVQHMVGRAEAQIGTMQREIEELKALHESLRPWTKWVEAQVRTMRSSA